METFKAFKVHMYQPTQLQIKLQVPVCEHENEVFLVLVFLQLFFKDVDFVTPASRIGYIPSLPIHANSKDLQKKIIYIHLSCKIVKNILLSSYCLLNKKCQNLSFVTYFFSKFLDIDSDSDIRFKHSMMLKIVISDSSVQKNVIV